jgi:hypothetical protein
MFETILITTVFCLLIGLPFINVAMITFKPSLYKDDWVDGIHADGTVKRYSFTQ